MKPTHKEITAAITKGLPPPATRVPAWVRRAVIAIEQDICDRRGIKHEWNAIDDETQQDIRRTWAALILREHFGAS